MFRPTVTVIGARRPRRPRRRPFRLVVTGADRARMAAADARIARRVAAIEGRR